MTENDVVTLGLAHNIDAQFGVYGAPCGYGLRRAGLYSNPRGNMRVELTYMPDEEPEVSAFLAWRIKQPNSPPPALDVVRNAWTIDPAPPTFFYAWTVRAAEVYKKAVAQRDAANSKSVSTPVVTEVTDVLQSPRDAAQRINEGSCGMIYFARAAGTEFVKIGYTAGAPADRIRSLQTGSFHELVLFDAIEGTPDDERRLHLECKRFHHRGEWFRMSDADLVRLIRDQRPRVQAVSHNGFAACHHSGPFVGVLGLCSLLVQNRQITNLIRDRRLEDSPFKFREATLKASATFCSFALCIGHDPMSWVLVADEAPEFYGIESNAPWIPCPFSVVLGRYVKVFQDLEQGHWAETTDPIIENLRLAIAWVARTASNEVNAEQMSRFAKSDLRRDLLKCNDIRAFRRLCISLGPKLLIQGQDICWATMTNDRFGCLEVATEGRAA